MSFQQFFFSCVFHLSETIWCYFLDTPARFQIAPKPKTVQNKKAAIYPTATTSLTHSYSIVCVCVFRRSQLFPLSICLLCVLPWRILFINVWRPLFLSTGITSNIFGDGLCVRFIACLVHLHTTGLAVFCDLEFLLKSRVVEKCADYCRC